jgi:hypothetical protein
MSTVGIFGIQFNGWYEEYLDGWFDACLAARPDQIVLVSDQIRPVPDGVDLVVVDEMPVKHQMTFFANKGVESLSTDWCWAMDVDDLILYDSVDQIRNVDADVWCAGMTTTQGSVYIPRGMSADRMLSADRNFMNGCSAFKKSLWQEVGGYPALYPPDWGLWRKFARVNAKFESSGRADYLYRIGHISATRDLTAEEKEKIFAL